MAKRCSSHFSLATCTANKLRIPKNPGPQSFHHLSPIFHLTWGEEGFSSPSLAGASSCLSLHQDLFGRPKPFDTWLLSKNDKPYQIVISCHLKPKTIYANNQTCWCCRNMREGTWSNFRWLFLKCSACVCVVHTSTPFLLPSRHPAWLRHGHSPWQCWQLLRIQQRSIVYTVQMVDHHVHQSSLLESMIVHGSRLMLELNATIWVHK